MSILSRKWAQNSIYQHKLRGFIFEGDVSISKVHQLMKDNLGKKCIYCGKTLSLDEGSYKASLDIINPRHLVNMDNLQIICKKCNEMKGRKNHSEFLRFRQTPQYLKQVKCFKGNYPTKITGRLY